MNRFDAGGSGGIGVLSDADWALLARRLRLSEREVQVVRRLMAEQKDRAIATDLGMSIHTVRTHLDRLFRKLDVHSRTGIVVAVFVTYVGMVKAARHDAVGPPEVRRDDPV